MEKQILTSKEAAILLSCAESTLKQSRVKGKLFGTDTPKFMKRGRSVRYKLETLDNWMAQFSEQSNTGIQVGYIMGFNEIPDWMNLPYLT